MVCCFLFIFSSEERMNETLENGLWFTLKQAIMLKSDLRILISKEKILLLFLHGLILLTSLQCIKQSLALIIAIASKLGKPSNASYLDFSRVCIEMNACNSFINQFLVEDKFGARFSITVKYK